MLATATLVLLAASVNAAWVRPEPRFAAPSGTTTCAYRCPDIPNWSVQETVGTTVSTTDCTYSGSTTGSGRCVYSKTTFAETSGAADCPATTTGVYTCPSTYDGTSNGLPGTFRLVNAFTIDSYSNYCFYAFYSTDVQTQGTCTFQDSDGGLISGTLERCPTDADSTCLLRRTREETKLEKAIRARQYRPSKPSRM